MRLRFTLVSPKGTSEDLTVTADRDLQVRELSQALGLGERACFRDSCGRGLEPAAKIGQVLRHGSRVEVSQQDVTDASVAPACEHVTDGSKIAARPPRDLPDLEDSALVVPEPPDPPMTVARLSVAMMVVPLILGGVLIFVFGPLMVVFALLTPVMMAGSFLEDRFRKRRWRKKAALVIGEALPAFREAMQSQARYRIEREEYFSPTGPELLSRALSPSTGRLWERRTGDPDFRSVTVGSSTRALAPTLGETRRELFPQVAEAVSEFESLSRMPARLDLVDGGAVGVVGPVAARQAWLRHIIAEAAVGRGPADLRIAALARNDLLEMLPSLKWLPHCGADAASGDLLIGADPKSDQAVLRKLGSDAAEAPVPTILVADSASLTGRTETMVRELVASRSDVALIAVGSHRDQLLEICDPVVEHYADGFRVAATRETTNGESGERVQLSPEEFDRCCRALAGWRDPLVAERAADLPVSVPLVALTPEAMSVDGIVEQWRRNSRCAPVATLGSGEGEIVRLSLLDDGPHGLAGGTTGSGKSELLRTLVISLALHSSPEDLNFLLVDYKGGAAFDLCAGLPHIAGLVTDLDEHLAERALSSLKAELHRRERFLRPHQVEDIDAYWRLGRAESLPRLFVIIDEFADLATDLPEFVESLVKISQKGRSLGVHLLLATQRPAGVIKDNIRANTNYRIALRTQRASDSDDIIDSKDAARLPRTVPGRALIRYGGDEPLPFQAASVSFSTLGSNAKPVTVHRFDASLHPDQSVLLDPAELAPTDAIPDAVKIAERIDLAALAAGAERARPIWAETLNEASTHTSSLEALDFAATGDPSGAWLLGTADNPEKQCHEPWLWDPTKDGNLVCFGTGATGVSDLLVTAGCLAHCANEPFEVFALDFNGTGLSVLEECPAVGAVIRGGERERITRLLGYLNGELDQRRRSAAAFHRILLLVDGYAGFRSEFESPSDYVYQDAIARVVRDGANYGIHTILTAHQPSAIPNTVTSTVTNRAVFALADRHDFAALGVSVSSVPELSKGQCIQIPGNLVVQVTTVAGEVVDQMATRTTKRAPRQIGTLPYSVKIEELVDEVELASCSWRVPIGVSDVDLAVAYVDLGAHEHLMIAGPAKSGRTEMLLGLSELLNSAQSRPVIVGLAPARSRLHDASFPVCSAPTDLLEAVEVLPTDRPIALLVDDAIRVDPENLLNDVVAASNEQVHVFAAERSDLLRNTFNHWTRDLRQQGTGLICRAQHEADNDLFGVRIPRHDHPPAEHLAAVVAAGAATIIRPVGS